MRQSSPQAPVRSFLQLAASGSAKGSATNIEATYLLGRDLTDTDPREAAKVLKPLVDDRVGGPLQPYILAAYANALDADGKSDDGSKQWKVLLQTPSLPGALEEQAFRGLAADSDDADDVVEWLAKLVKRTSAAADRLELAQAAKDAGDTKTFQAQLHAIITGDPGSHEAIVAVQALHEANIPVDPGDEALVDYRHSDYAAVEALLGPAVKAKGISPEQRTFRLYYLAASYEDQDKKDEAIAFYDKAASTGAKSPFVHRAKYWAANVMERTGDAKDASARYAALVRNGPKGEFTAEAAFRAGDLLFKAGEPAAAVQMWESTGKSNDPRLLYWKGRAAEAANLPDAAQASFEAAAKAAPFDFYGIEAAAQLSGTKQDVGYRTRTLSAEVDWDTVSAWLAKLKGDGKIPGPSTAAAELMAVGLRDEARAALLDAAHGVNAWQVLGLVLEARADGLFDASATLMSQLTTRLGVTDGQLPAAVLQLKYPIGYVVQITAVAKENGIDPLFLAATIYQESLWDPEAGSYAGAIGLLQLIASTAVQIGKRAGVADVTAADLFQPKLNLQLGATFLGQQLKSFGDPALALAAYNAGPGNAARWQSAWDRDDAASLVDGMDFGETASYVEQIYGWYALYQAAYA
jgi:soluble lytic murein transglycosylase